MEKLSEDLFEIIKKELGEEKTIAEFFLMMPDEIMRESSFTQRLEVCVYAEHSKTCRCLAEIRDWLADAVESEEQYRIACDHIPTGASAELILAQRYTNFLF